MESAINRRAFIVASAAALAVTMVKSEDAQADSRFSPTGPVYGRVGMGGLRPGSVEVPAMGTVTLLDGRAVKVRHETRFAIAPGGSVLIAPASDGVFSVLYAEI